MSTSCFAVYVDDKDEFANFDELGYWMSFHIYRIETSLIPRLNLAGKRIVFMPEDVALAWKFAGAKRPFIHFSGESTKQKQQIPTDKLSEYKPGKYEYVLTEQDIANAVKFMKLVIAVLANNYYEQIWQVQKPQISFLHELASFSGIGQPLKKQKQYAEVLESILARRGRIEALLSSATSIAECNSALEQLQIDVGI